MNFEGLRYIRGSLIAQHKVLKELPDYLIAKFHFSNSKYVNSSLQESFFNTSVATFFPLLELIKKSCHWSTESEIKISLTNYSLIWLWF